MRWAAFITVLWWNVMTANLAIADEKRTVTAHLSAAAFVLIGALEVHRVWSNYVHGRKRDTP